MRARIAVLCAAIAAVVAFQAAIAVPVSRAGVPTNWTMSLDCDTTAVGIQSTCMALPGSPIDVDAVLTNNTTGAVQFGRFGLGVLNPNITRIYARDVNGIDLPACGAAGFNCNPHFLLASAGAYACNIPFPDNDRNEDGNPMTQESFIDCLNGAADGQMIAPGESVALARVKYRVPMNAPAGSVPLTMFWTDAGDESFGELGSCSPMISIPMECNGATITIANVSMSVDCNATTVGIQSNCMVSNLATTRDVRVVVTNHGSTGILIGSFGFKTLNPDITRLFAPVINPPGFSNDNPDAAMAAEGVGWDCGPSGPWNDDAGTVEPGQDSFISCFNSTGGSFMIGAGASVHVATVHYNIVAGADPGPVPLTLAEANVYSSTFSELGTCLPVIGVLMPCNPATVTMYCPIDMADVNNDNIVNVADMGITAANNGVLPAPAHLDQNFDGVINVADRGLIASFYSKRPTIHCP